jgi:hypothetical protein
LFKKNDYKYWLPICFVERAESDGEHMHPKVVLGASVSLVAYFCTECGKRISLLENKISDSYKLLAKILLFCLGEATVFAKLVHEIGNLSEFGSSNDLLLWGSFRHCVQVIQCSLHSTDIQVDNYLCLLLAPRISFMAGG